MLGWHGFETICKSQRVIEIKLNLQLPDYIYILHLLCTTHEAGEFSLSTITVSAESVDDLATPAVRVTWSTTVQPGCVTSVRVDFRTNSHGAVVATYNTTNISQTEVIQTDLLCTTNYYITAVVTGVILDGIHATLSSRSTQVFIGGKELVHA